MKIQRRGDGKPEANGSETISTTHADGMTLAVAREGALACDLESVVERTDEAWTALLGPHRMALAGVIAQNLAEDTQAAATRVWTAMECLKKGGAIIDTPLVIESTQEDGWILLSAGQHRIASCVTCVRDTMAPLAMGFLVGS